MRLYKRLWPLSARGVGDCEEGGAATLHEKNKYGSLESSLDLCMWQLHIHASRSHMPEDPGLKWQKVVH